MKLRNIFSRRHASSLSDADDVSLPEHPATPVPPPAAVTPPFTAGEAQKIMLGEGAVWDTEAYPHILIAGPPDTGKTRIQRLILEHCIHHQDQWRVYGMDLYRTQLTSYVEHGTPVEHIAQTVSESILDLRLVQDEMRGRLMRMKNHGYKSYRELAGELPAIMVVIDESYHVLPAIMTLAQQRTATKFDVRIESLNILKELTECGARAGIHISMATRVPEQGITDDLRKNVTCRVVTGVFPVKLSQLMLGADADVRLVPGESYIQCEKQGKTFMIMNSSG